MAPNTTVRRCKECGRFGSRARGLSRNDLHPECAYRKMARTVRALRDKAGPEYEAWRERIKAATDRL